MDSNNTPYFLLREPEEFVSLSSRVVWNQQKKALVIAQNQDVRLPDSDSVFALSQWKSAAPLVLDEFFQQARISPSGDVIEYDSGREFLPLDDGELNPLQAPFGSFTDVSIGGDGRLAATFSDTAQHGVLVFQLAKRWQTTLELPEEPIRVVVDGENKIWCVTETFLICCEGGPLPHDYILDKTRFEPVRVNPHSLKIVWQTELEATDQPLAICVDDEKLYLLIHTSGTENQIIKVRSLTLTNDGFKSYPVSEECPFTIDIGCLSHAYPSKGQLAMLAPRESDDSQFIKRDCAVVQLEWNQQQMSGEAMLVRERYPMLSQASARFVSSLDGKLRYQAIDDVSDVLEAEPAIKPRELHPLRRPHYYLATLSTLTEVLDSEHVNTTWHRVYMEGCIPSGTKVVLYAKAFNSLAEHASAPFIRQSEWHWCNHRSDVPFGKGLVNPVSGEQGLFELLLQRDKGPVRRLAGRYLKFRIRLESDGRYTPAIHALKVYYPRFSYQENYFPEHFRQEQEVDPSLDELPANGADIRERMLAAFESTWTPLEGQIASSEVLLSPEHTPEQHLPWLAELLGQNIPEHWPAARTRRWLAATGILQRWRGTLAGLNLVLDIITDGAVARGQVVLVENFRLRRTMATILGLLMDDADHPLTLGTGMSGNSIVSESLILAEEDAREFLALFAPELATNQEKKTVDAFFEKYAHQVSVVLHGDAKKLESVVSETLENEMPAHLEWQILQTDHPFILGLSPLLAVDTYLEKRPPPQKVKLDDTWLGREGVLTNASAFSPRDINA